MPRACRGDSRSPAASSSRPRMPRMPGGCRTPARRPPTSSRARSRRNCINASRGSGKKIPTPFDIDDLIVDDDTLAALTEIAAAARQRRKIRDAFKLRGPQGISVLFSGHPGVGKTMSGTVLGAEAARPRDLRGRSCRKSCRSGSRRDRKDLSDVFDAAEPRPRRAAVQRGRLAVPGKRTSDVKSSNDRGYQPTSRPTTCCNGSSDSAGSRS